MSWPQLGGHPGKLTQSGLPGRSFCSERGQQDAFSFLQQAILWLDHCCCANKTGPETKDTRSVAMRKKFAAVRRPRQASWQTD
jgi:hypothetical protein